MSRGLHRFALLVTFSTFVLIVAGALVTSNGAGLAVPDWPLSFGQFFPAMVGNVFYEHGHRMIATTVGLLTIALNVYLWRREPRRWVRRLGLVALGAVVVQGLLGGLTVLLRLPLAISTAHACLAQLFFCMLVSLSVFTSPSWQAERAQAKEAGGWSLPVWLCAATVSIFVQLVLGATLRHSAAWDEHLPTELVVAHIVGACLVTVILGSAAAAIFRRHAGLSYLTRPATLASLLLVLQLGLGLSAYLTRLRSPDEPQPLNPMVWVTVAHVATGAALLAVTLMLTLRTSRVLKRSEEHSSVGYQQQEANLTAGR
jgi:cytochrome c oxidase assembly protein subunit 15